MPFFSFNGRGAVLRGGSSCNFIRSSRVAIKGTTVGLLLVWSFVGDCGGKPFHSVGQAEVEEDTTQGSRKEKFPLSLSIRSPVAPFTTDVNGMDGLENNSDFLANVDLNTIGNDRENGETWHSSSSSPVGQRNLNKDEHPRQHRHLSIPSNYGIVHKRSLGISPLSFSTASRDYLGAQRNDDDLDVDEREDFRREQRSRLSPALSSSTLPIYGQSSMVGRGGSSAVSSDINPSGDPDPGFRMRQRLLNLRNQFGDKWPAFVGPYAYRKRQILYRQCFFNPISCF